MARTGSTGERRELDLAAIVTNHASEWEPRYAARRRQLSISFDHVAPVVATPGLVGQVLDILLDNALRHGAGSVAIVLRGTSVTVSDEGHGVPEQRVATLFDRPTDPGAAHGRGLSLARRLAEADGGSVELVRVRPAMLRLSLLAACGH